MSVTTPFADRELLQSTDTNGLNEAIERGRAALLARQHHDGHWCFELESDCTITRSEEHTSELQ